MFLSTGRVFIETGPGSLARSPVLLEQHVNHGERRMLNRRFPFCLKVLGGFSSDMTDQAEGNFVGNRQRPDRHPGLAGLGLDHRRTHPLTKHGDAFMDKGAEDPRCEETATVVNHNRRLVDLPDEIETTRQGCIAGVSAPDDLHQRHFFHRTEEMQADEFRRVGNRSGQAGDGQRRGIGGDHRIRPRYRLGGRRHLGFQVAILEHRFDDQLATGQLRIVVSGMNPRQRDFTLLRGDLLAGDLLVQQRGQTGFALLRGSQVDILEDHLDPGQGADTGNAGPHHASAEHSDFFCPVRRIPVWARPSGLDLVELEPKRTDQILGDLPRGQFSEIAGLDQVRRVITHLGTLHRRTEDFLRRRQAALGPGAQDRRGNRQRLHDTRIGRRPPGNPIALYVPRLDRVRVGEDPGPRLVQQLITIDRQLIDQSGLQRLSRANPLAFEQIRQGPLQAKQTHHPHHPAAARQQAQSDFRQPDLHRRMIQRHAMMASQADLPTASERRTVDSGHHWLAQRLEGAQLRLESQDHLVESLGLGLADRDQLVEIATGEECLLGRGDDHAGDRIAFGNQTSHAGGHGLTVNRVHGIGALARQVHCQDDNPVLAGFVTNGSGH
ncbi:hypothetical protein SRABI112_03723 [Pseudomonas mediterranea]|nr:hypothetical protein SRABI112_03723 [Pseudomonas mediterranea]